MFDKIDLLTYLLNKAKRMACTCLDAGQHACCRDTEVQETHHLWRGCPVHRLQLPLGQVVSIKLNRPRLEVHNGCRLLQTKHVTSPQCYKAALLRSM